MATPMLEMVVLVWLSLLTAIRPSRRLELIAPPSPTFSTRGGGGVLPRRPGVGAGPGGDAPVLRGAAAALRRRLRRRRRPRRRRHGVPPARRPVRDRHPGG